MKVCLVSHSSHLGGAERVLLETIEILQAEGIECRAILPSKGELGSALNEIHVPVSVISFPLWVTRGSLSLWLAVKTALNTVKDALVVAWLMRRWGCEIVYTNTATLCVGALAARMLGLPHVWHIHEFGAEDHGLKCIFGERFYRLILKTFSTHCIFVSNALVRKYEGSIDACKRSVIYPSMHWGAAPGASDSTSSDATANTFRCLMVGALTEGKGQTQGILAMGILRDRGIPAQLTLAGKAQSAWDLSLKAMVESMLLGDRVSLVGSVPNALPLMRNADAVLVCSRSEAFGRVTAEAMLAGKPVIGARSGATIELIRHGFNGLLYTPGDTEDLADKITYLYANPEIAQRLAENAETWAKKIFSRERYGRQIKAALTSCVEGEPHK